VKPGEPHAADPEILFRMMRALEHRGPDDEGSFVSEGAFLGHRRLSIIDLEAGRQPIANEDGRIRVVFNGEIYNHKDLRRDLEARGHRFESRTDGEVLPHLWEQEREAMLGRLNGMFAFALWDGRDRSLILARDRMGKKPLFWGVFDGELVFASELRALLRHPSVPREVEPAALYRFLTLDYVPTPHAILVGVRKVMPGGYVQVKDGIATEGRFTDIRVPSSPLRLPPKEAAQLVHSTLSQAVIRRLESDVPLGVFLSGGLDSVAVTAAFCDHVPPSEVQTFTLGFDEPSFDESDYAGRVAAHLGTRHHCKVVSVDDAAVAAREVTAIADEPLGDPSLVPTWLLSRFARENVTVVLSGDGGDELFYGYPTFLSDPFASVVSAVLPGFALDRVLPWLAGLIPVSDRDMSLDFKVSRFVRGLPYGRFDRHLAWIGGFTPAGALEVLHPDASAGLAGLPAFPDSRAWLERTEGWPDAKALAYLYCRLYLQDGVLAKVDRASMAVGLEVRSPFLDPEMVRLAFALPADLSLGPWQTKKLVRSMLAGRIPPGILRRPKKGFGMPVSRWLRTGLKTLLDEHLDPRKLAREGVFRPEVVSRLVAEHLSGKFNHRKELWNLLVFEMWLSRYLL
jgi:asparagine synthase (glutamine-hydrolysing)